MKNIIIKIAGACAAVAATVILSLSAHADGSRPSIWQGVYAGGSIGGAFTDFDKIDDIFKEKLDEGDIVGGFYIDEVDGDRDGDSLTGGLHIGYNYQNGNVVVGIEGDINFLNSEIWLESKSTHFNQGYDEVDTDKTTVGIDYLASLRGRIGYATDKALLYATAGVAWTELKVTANDSWDYGQYGSGSETETFNETLTGFVVGGGAEYMVWKNVSLRGEVLHYQFNFSPDDDDTDFESDVNVTVGKVGVSYKF